MCRCRPCRLLSNCRNCRTVELSTTVDHCRPLCQPLSTPNTADRNSKLPSHCRCCCGVNRCSVCRHLCGDCCADFCGRCRSWPARGGSGFLCNPKPCVIRSRRAMAAGLCVTAGARCWRAVLHDYGSSGDDSFFWPASELTLRAAVAFRPDEN